MAIDATNLAAKVKANADAREGCPRHYYEPRPEGYRIGDRLTCARCGATDRLSNVGRYVAGYVAAGGHPADLGPDWASYRRRPQFPAPAAEITGEVS